MCTHDNYFLSYSSAYFRSRLTQLTLANVSVTLGQVAHAMLVRAVLLILALVARPMPGLAAHATHVQVVLLMLVPVAALTPALVVQWMLVRVALLMRGPVARPMLGPAAHVMHGPVGHAILAREVDGIVQPSVDD